MRKINIFNVTLFILLIASNCLYGQGATVPYSDLYSPSTFFRTIDLSKPVGCTEGAPSSNAFGGASYTVPIACPAGTNGVSPRLSINYSSQSASGQLGMGWAISGISSITRTGLDILHHSKTTPTTYDKNDVFLLDGNYLTLRSGTHGIDGAVYGQELESYNIITCKGSFGGDPSRGPESFKIVQKDGSIYEYGSTSVSRQLTRDGSMVAAWYLSRVIDVNGNYIEFEYDNSNFDFRLSKVRYTGNVNTGLLPYAEIAFNYLVRSDKNIRYGKNFTQSSKYLLDNIVISSEGSIFKKYLFSYGTNYFGESFLKSLREESSDGISLNDTRFLYGDQTAAFSESLNHDLIMPTYSTDVSNGDFDGDGLSDFLVCEYSSSGSGYIDIELKIKKRTAASSTYTTVCSKTISGAGVRMELGNPKIRYSQRKIVPQASDFNGDGRDDIIISNFLTSPKVGGGLVSTLDYIEIYYSNVDGTIPSTYSYRYTAPSASSAIVEGSDGQQHYLFVGDFDGDGLADFITMLGGDIYFHSPGRGIVNKAISRINFSSGSYLADGSGLNLAFDLLFKNASQISVVNIDGDMKTDLMVVSGSTTRMFTFDFNAYLYDLHLNQVGPDLGYPNKWHDINLGDFNGDGLTDILTGPSRELAVDKSSWELGLFNGQSFEVVPFEFDHIVKPFQTGYTNTDRILISDFNGDGKSDIVDIYSPTSSGSELNVYFRTGLGFKFLKPSHSYNVEFAYSIGISDFNGDGKAEIYARRESSAASGDAVIYSFNSESEGNLLKKVLDGYNRTTEFHYQSLTKASVYTTNPFYKSTLSESYPYFVVKSPYFVLTKMKTPDGIGGTIDQEYSYEDMLSYKAGGRGILGFHKVKVLNLASDLRTESVFEINRDFVTMYMKSLSSFNHSSGIKLSQTDNNVVFTRGRGSCIVQELTGTTNIDHLKGVTTSTTYTYDGSVPGWGYGNVVSCVSTISDISGVRFSKETTSTYVATAGSSFPNKPEEIIEKVQRTGQPSVSNWTKMEYTAKGLVSSIKVAPNSTRHLHETTNRSYDDFGNLTETYKYYFLGTVNKDFQKWEYDVKGRFQTSATNKFGDKSYYTYSNLWGKPISITGENGLTSTFLYDGFGQIAQKFIPTSSSSGYNVNLSYVWKISGNGLYSVITDDPSGPDENTWYDILARPITIQKSSFLGSVVEKNITYDSRGNKKTTSNFYLPSETPQITTYSYDNLNRLISISSPLGVTSFNFSLGGGTETIQTTLPDGKVEKATKDATGLLVKSTKGIAGTVHHTYDSRGNLLNSAVGSEGTKYYNLITKEYDNKGRLTKMTDADAGTVSYAYDFYGRLMRQTDPKGVNTSFEYDDYDRIVGKSIDTAHFYFSYWGASRTYQIQSSGCHTPNTSIEEFWSYDVTGKVLTHIKSDAKSGVHIKKNYSYDGYNNLETTENLHSGFKTKNYYDGNGFLVRTTTNFSSAPALEKELYKTIAMDGEGNITQFKRVDGTVGTISYQNGVVVNQKTPTIQDLSTYYDFANGNVVMRVDNITSTKEVFEYDAIDRLTKATAQKMGIAGLMHFPLAMSYKNNFWGSFGQLESKSDAGSYSYSGPTIKGRNAVKSITDPSSLVSHETQNIVYNPFQRVQTISEKISGVDYEERFIYGGDGERAYSQKYAGISPLGSIVRKRWYDGDYEIDQQISGASINNRNIHYLSSDAGLVGLVVLNGGIWEYYGVYTDHLGSIVTMTNQSGVVVGKQSFDPWGRKRNADTWGDITPLAGTSSPEMPSWVIRGYTGHEMLPEYGLINMNARLYDPINARMLSPDNEVAFPNNSQSYNRYSYAMNNPVSYVDPDGNHPVLIGMAFAAISSAAYGGMRAESLNQNVFSGMLKGAAIGAVSSLATGSVSSILNATGVFPGLLVGAGTGALSGGLSGAISAALNGDNMGDGFKNGIIFGAIGGAVSGAVSGGINAAQQHRGLFWGSKPGVCKSPWAWKRTEVFTYTSPINAVEGMESDYCVPTSLESVSRSYGQEGETQYWWADQYFKFTGVSVTKNKGSDWEKMARVARLNGYSTKVIMMDGILDGDQVGDYLKGGNRILVGFPKFSYLDANNIPQVAGHMMVLKSMSKFSDGAFNFELMDPNGGIFRTYSGAQLKSMDVNFYWIKR